MIPAMASAGDARKTTAGADTPTPWKAVPGARRALALLLLLNLFNYIDRQVLPAVELPISIEFGVSKTLMGYLATGFLLVYMITAPVFGWMADRSSRWLLVAVGIIIQALASGGSGLATSYGMLLVMRCIIGVGDAAYGPAAPTLIADMFPIARRGQVMAWFYAAIPVGSAIGYGLGGLMRWLTGDWRWAFYVLLPPMMVLGVICLMMRDPRQRVSGDVARPKIKLRDYLQLVRNRSYVINCAGMTAMTFAIGGIAFWMPRYLEAYRGISPTQANIGFGAVVAVAGLFATLAGGIVGDRLRRRFPGSYFLVSSAGMLVGFPLTLLMLITPFPYAWIVIFLAVFCLFFNTGPSNTILANVTHSSIRASAFAVNIFVIHLLGDAISPPIIGWIADRSSLPMGFVVVSGMMLVGGLIWLCGARYLEADTQAASDDPPPAPATSS
jgi:MFS transporter, Spinster family, sphingosine-1-phosphate transporter